MTTTRRALVVGASRGLGLAIAGEYLQLGWDVVATVRHGTPASVRELRERSAGRLAVETVDVTNDELIASLGVRLAGRAFDLLFVNAGVTNDDAETAADVSHAEFARVMLTNALAPLRTIETLGTLVAEGGTIGIMSSGQGSVANNASGGHEIYRASKAALNTLMRSYAARHAGDRRTLLLMAPGWVRTELGGPNAKLAIDDSIPKLVSTMEARRGAGGLHYLDYLGRTVPW